MQSLLIFVVAIFTFLTTVAWGQQPISFHKPRMITLRATVTEVIDFEEMASRDVVLNYVVGDLKRYIGLNKEEVAAVKRFAQNGFLLLSQKNVSVCSDSYIVIDLDNTFDNDYPANDGKIIKENTKVLSFVCNR